MCPTMRWRLSAASRPSAKAARAAIARSRPRKRSGKRNSGSESASGRVRCSDALRLAPVGPCDGRVAGLGGTPRTPSRMAAHIFRAVDRSDMRRIAVVIGPPDAVFLAVLVDPAPEGFAGRLPHCAGRAVDAHDVGRKPVAIAAAEA